MGSALSLSSSYATYTVEITTGDKPKLGCSTSIYIILHGEQSSTDRHLLHVDFPPFYSFKRGQTNNFYINDKEVGKISYIEIWQATALDGSEWFIDSISVTDNRTHLIPFPVFQGIRPYYLYKIKPYDTSLPQEVYGDWIEERKQELEWKRQEYILAADYDVRKLPRNEQFTFSYSLDTIAGNFLCDTLKNFYLSKGEWNTIEDVKDLYKCNLYQPPSNMNRWQDDEDFGAQRLRGTNPMQICLCEEIPDKFAINIDEIEGFLDGQTLQDAIASKRIFIIDYAILKGCPTKDGLTVCSPIALFYQRDDGNLVPIAIQLFQDKADDNPVFLPSDPKYTWILAKMWFNNADAQIHQSIAHLGFTHLLMEDIMITVNRTISGSHPIYKLLAPHFLYLMAINNLARTTLISQGGMIDQIMSAGAKGVHHLFTQSRAKWRMDVDGSLPEELKKRGVLDENLLPNYYSRNDAIKVYEAIHQYVTSYVKLYYKDDSVILADEEIQAWRKEMVTSQADGGAGLNGIPGENCQFTTREQLVIALTSFIYTCSVDHALVNFLQYDAYAFPPNYPPMLIGSPPKTKEPLSEKDIVYALAGKREALAMLKLASVLSTRATKSLGDFEVNYVFEVEACQIVDGFRQLLKTAGEFIENRDKKRPVSYDVLYPRYIPNAISI